MYTAKQLSNLFNCSVETIRLQSIEFQQYLSPRSNLGKQRTRDYSDEDLGVFALIHEMKNAGQVYADIHAALANGERADPPQNMIAVMGNEIARATTLQSKVNALQSEVERLREVEHENIELTALLEDTRKRLAEKEEELKLAYKQIGRLEG